MRIRCNTVRRPWPRTDTCSRTSPTGVPPLPLTGERTLPDVPEENYWYRRHLVVYEWIAARVGGLRVVDMACGEGYGSDVLARERRGERRRRRRQPGGPRARAAALRAAQPALRARPGRRASPSPATRSSSCRRSSTSQDAGAILEHFKSMLAPGGVAYVSTPNLLTLAPPGAEKSDNPWHVQGVPRRGVPRALRGPLRPGRAARPLPRPQAARPRAGDQARLGQRPQAPRPDQALLRPLHAGDRRLRFRARRRATSTARSTSSPSADPEARRRGADRRDGRRPGDRPPLPHALRRGLRDLPVRRGVALRRGRSAPTCRCSRWRAT